jgi:hypothetical protein
MSHTKSRSPSMLSKILPVMVRNFFRKIKIDFCKNKETSWQHKVGYNFYKIITYEEALSIFVALAFVVYCVT